MMIHALVCIADLDVVSKTPPVKSEVKEEPVDVKMEGIAENEPNSNPAETATDAKTETDSVPNQDVEMQPASESQPSTAPEKQDSESLPQDEVKPNKHGNKENIAPYKTPAAKKVAQYAKTPGFTPPSTGYNVQSVLSILCVISSVLLFTAFCMDLLSQQCMIIILYSVSSSTAFCIAFALTMKKHAKDLSP